MNNKAQLIDMQVGAALRRERKAAGWSQTQLGDAVGVSAAQVGKYERGVDRISASSLYLFCQALGVSIDLMYNQDPNRRDRIDEIIYKGLDNLTPEGREAILLLIEALPGHH